MGAWKNYQTHMKWTDDHFWEINIKLTNPIFQYKYVVLESKSSVLRWEQGLNRIADLPLLSSQNGGSESVTLNDLFDRYTVNFSIYYPLKDREYMRINGDPAELGLWNKGLGPIAMKLS